MKRDSIFYEEKLFNINLPKEGFELRKYGSVPLSGYGVGFERLVQYVTGMDNIRDCVAFPRHPGNAEF